MSVWKRLTNVAKGTVKGTVKSWTGDAPTPGEAALEAELEEMRSTGGSAPRQRTSGVPARDARPAVRNAHVDPARNPVQRTDLFPTEAPSAPEVTGKKDLLTETAPANLAPESDAAPEIRAPKVASPPEPDPAPVETAAGTLSDAASRVMGAVDDVLESAPDPFASFTSSGWDLLPADDAPHPDTAPTPRDVQDADEVGPDETEDGGPGRTL